MASGEAELSLRTVLAYNAGPLGANHPRTERVALTLADLLWQQCRVNEAADLQEQVLQRNIKALGQDYRRTLNVMAKLGENRRQQGRFAESIDLITAIQGLKNPIPAYRHSAISCHRAARRNPPRVLPLRRVQTVPRASRGRHDTMHIPVRDPHASDHRRASPHPQRHRDLAARVGRPSRTQLPRHPPSPCHVRHRPTHRPARRPPALHMACARDPRPRARRIGRHRRGGREIHFCPPDRSAAFRRRPPLNLRVSGPACEDHDAAGAGR